MSFLKHLTAGYTSFTVMYYQLINMYTISRRSVRCEQNIVDIVSVHFWTMKIIVTSPAIMACSYVTPSVTYAYIRSLPIQYYGISIYVASQ